MQTRPLLTSGTADPAVHELGRALAELGYENSVSDGTNPYGVVDDTLLQAVNQFRRDNDVADDRDGIPGPVEEHRRWIGPATWEAIAQALDDHQAKAEAIAREELERRDAEPEPEREQEPAPSWPPQ